MEERPIDELGAWVAARFEKARAAKQPHHKKMLECMKLMNGEALTPKAPDLPDINLDVASPIITNIVALIRDIFGGASAAKPYTIHATPVAELPDDVLQDIYANMLADLEMLVVLHNGDTDAVRKQIDEMKSMRLLEENRRAALAAEKLSAIIEDRLHDAEWEAEFIKFINHYVVYPSAVMKAPSVQSRTRMRWNGNTLTTEQRVMRMVETISPFDFYPAPFAQDVQSADYVIERRRLTRAEFLALRDVAGYDADAIDDVIENNPDGAALSYSAEETDPMSDTFGDSSERDIFDALGYYGTIRNDVLQEYDIDFAKEELSGSSEAEVWVVGKRVIKCLLNPNKAGRRPFYTASFDSVPGAFWGISPAMKLIDVQRLCTGTVRNLVANMALASGPIGEVNKARVADGNDITQIIPRTMRLVKDDMVGSSTPAFRFHTVPSLSGELLAQFERYLSYAYEVLGIPRVAFGQTQGLGTVGRTSGGLSIIANQAHKTFKHALRHLEKDLIEPVVQDFIHYELLTTDDRDIRGDVRVYARGVSGLMEQEQRNGDLEWALQSIVPMVGTIDPETQRPVIPASAVQRLLFQLFKNRGISTHGIFPDFDQQEAMGEMMSGIAPTDINDPQTQLPPMDGRNGAAGPTIEQMNEGIG